MSLFKKEAKQEAKPKKERSIWGASADSGNLSDQVRKISDHLVFLEKKLDTILDKLQNRGGFSRPSFGGGSSGGFRREGGSGRPGQGSSNRYGGSQRPGQYGGSRDGGSQRPGQYGGSRDGGSQRPGQYGGSRDNRGNRGNREFRGNRDNQGPNRDRSAGAGNGSNGNFHRPQPPQQPAAQQEPEQAV